VAGGAVRLLPPASNPASWGTIRDGCAGDARIARMLSALQFVVSYEPVAADTCSKSSARSTLTTRDRLTNALAIRARVGRDGALRGR
jgi:hypothetical protein